MLKSIQEKMGPGLMFAAAAVGVSHLVQSTRGGASFGLNILFFIVFICLLKYPLFLFSAHYTAITGDTIIDGYKKLGRWILFVIFIVYVLELPFAIAGISVVSATIMIKSLGLEMHNMVGAMLLVGVCLLFSAVGRYRTLEHMSRVFVALFLVCILIGTFISVATNVQDYHLALSPIEPSRGNLLFLVALAGWMPTGIGGSLGISLWIHAKNRRIGRNLNLREVRFDFNFSYAIVIITACCFALMGAFTLFSDQYTPPAGSTGNFADELFAIFTPSFPAWTHFLVKTGANVVLVSSLLIVVDLLPRLGSNLLQRLYPTLSAPNKQSRLYQGFVLYELVSVTLVLTILFDSFSSFIDLVTSLGFLAAPIIAWLNHKIVFSGELTPQQQPSTLLRYWNLTAIVFMALVSTVYVALKILNWE